MYTQSHFYVHLQIPVSRELAWYYLYQTHIFVIPSQSHNLQAYTKLTSEVTLLAISYSGEYFLEITKDERNHCHGTDILQCSIIPKSLHYSHPTCLYSIFKDLPQSASSQYDHIVYMNQGAPPIYTQTATFTSIGGIGRLVTDYRL